MDRHASNTPAHETKGEAMTEATNALAGVLAREAADRFQKYSGKSWDSFIGEIKGEVGEILTARFPILNPEFVRMLVERHVVITQKEGVTRLEMRFEEIAAAILKTS